MSMDYRNLRVEKREGVAVLTVNRPDKLNALNDETMAELDAAFAALGTDPEVRGVILTGAGEKAFVAGADISELATQRPVDGQERSRRGQEILDRIENLGKPVVAAVNGFALGGGCELAMACHVRVAAEGARLGTPEVRLGLMCGYAGTQRLPRLVGKGRALELLLTGEPIDAERAYEWGLVEELCAPGGLDQTLDRVAQNLVAADRSALRMQKELLHMGEELPLATCIAASIERFALAYAGGTPSRLIRKR